MTRPLGARTFDLEDQHRFASLSGDWNPLHVDPVAARRTMFGEPVVHGVHLASWALDRALGERGGGAVRIERIRATFRKPLFLGRSLELGLAEGSSDDDLSLVATSGGATMLELSARLVPPTTGVDEARPRSLRWTTREDAVLLRRDDVAGAAGDVDVALDPDLALELFPRLASSAPLLLAELLATTRVVGMRCPGLHSLYSGFDLRARNEAAPQRLSYRVKVANMRYSLVSIAVEGPSLAGTLDTFYRPAPSEPLRMDAVARAVVPGELSGQRALVIGGSRGLGEAFAKSIAAGGGEVCITYHRGTTEADAVVADIRASGGRASAFAFDATSPDDLGERWPMAEPPTHVYYFATPFIRVDPTAGFSGTDFDALARYYVTGLHAVARAVCDLGAEDVVLWAPSTTFLDTHERGAAAYCAAKAAMEELGRHLPSILPVRVLTPRLPKTVTDQTMSLIPVRSADPLALAVEHVRAAHALNRKS